MVSTDLSRSVHVWILLAVLSTCIQISTVCGESHVCSQAQAYSHRYHKKCGTFGWKKCTRHRTMYRLGYICCPGWTSVDGSLACDRAICDGKIDPPACENTFPNSHIINGDKTVQTTVTGTCGQPDQCECHTQGFYSTGPTCDICSPITNCDLEVCTTKTNQQCSRCEGVVREEAGFRAYNASVDKRQCLQACSWRSDSTICYPGTCAKELAANCNCSEGFSGRHCLKITEKPTIHLNMLILTADNGEKIEAPGNINAGPPQDTVWTNNLNFSSLQFEFTADFQPKVPNRHAYIKDFKVGIIYGDVMLQRVGKLFIMGNASLARNNSFFDNDTFDGNETLDRNYTFSGDDSFFGNDTLFGNATYPENVTYVENRTVTAYYTVQHFCSGDHSRYSPTQGVFSCSQYWTNLSEFSMPFEHQDLFYFTITTRNGGYVVIENKENKINTTSYYESETTIHNFTIQFDTVDPFHCKPEMNCTEDMLQGPDTSTEARVEFSWDGWNDTDAGIGEYHLAMFELHPVGEQLGVKGFGVDGKTSNNSIVITFPSPAVYAAILSAYDKAGNLRKARRIVVVDYESVVTTTVGSVLRVSSALNTTAYKWQNDLESVRIFWTNRYINTKHNSRRFLAGVQEDPAVTSEYDDHEGNRTIESIENIQAIVRFETVNKTDHLGGSSNYQPDDEEFENLKLQQEVVLFPILVDGDSLRFFIRAVDIVGVYKEENVTVHFDSSPPVIENLWLTKGDEVNLSVHGFDDLDKMTIEWLAYDDHSGLEEVEWRILDHNTEIEHGRQRIPPQGEASSMDDCQDKYKSAARGSNCYCTPISTCFHRHFQIKPPTTSSSTEGEGIHKNRGTHDHDYRIVVTVRNEAKLSTTLTKQITVDVTPPHAGAVHDGKYGQPEVDFQSDFDIYAHWDEFFDRESGVRFYHYGFSSSCLDANQFDIDLHKTQNISRTQSTHAEWTAPDNGKYYITVVAYNNAGEASSPVCSDGVTIDTTPPVITEIDLEGSRIKGGLVKVNDDVYFISENRRRYLLKQPDANCVNKALAVNQTDVYIFPLERYHNGSIHAFPSGFFCSKPSMTTVFLTKTYLAMHSHLYVNWTGSDIDSGIYDYEFGLSSDKDSFSAPDLLLFTSTHHHAWYKDYHPQLSDGTEFYISIKATNKAGLSTSQGFGPVIAHTVPPLFNGKIKVTFVNDTLKADWSGGRISDAESGQLTFTAAVGSFQGGQDVLQYSPLTSGEGCILATPPSCTVFPRTRLHWDLHHNFTYYVSVRVENIVGLHHVFTSEGYVHNTRRPNTGVVFDVVPPAEEKAFEITNQEDSNFQLSRTTLTARWFGFESDDLSNHVTYRVSVGSTQGGSDISVISFGSDVTKYTFLGLNLELHKTYYVTVRAISGAGSSQATSDGVTIVEKNTNLNDVVDVQDGRGCINQSSELAWKPNHYHDQYTKYRCESDIDYQPSISLYSAHWTILERYQHIYPDIKWTLQVKQKNTDDIWNDVLANDAASLPNNGGITLPVPLEYCNTYRSSVRFCTGEVCSQPVYSNGVTVLDRPPEPKIEILHSNIQAQRSQLSVKLTYPIQEDKVCSIENTTQKYLWSLTDRKHYTHLYTKWTELGSITKIKDSEFQFTIDLDGELDFSECRRLPVRIFNKAGLSTIVSADIRNCSAIDPMQIVPHVVLDAVGIPLGNDSNKNDRGNGILLEENAAWAQQDADYTPYKNIISAVWPTLRHKNYTWALLEDDTFSTLTHFIGNETMIRDPCSHPAALLCGYTDKEYVNISPNTSLEHGRRYHVCIHAEPTNISHEKWTEHLEEVNACTDGITVDLTPPTGGRVWVDNLINRMYQISTKQISVYWDSFIDVEENGGKTVHPSGIAHYFLAIGSVKGGEDIVTKHDVGLINHQHFRNLPLQNGHTYYVTLQAMDFVNRSKTIYSEGFIVDQTPPVVTSRPIQVTDTYVKSPDVLSLCWDGSFKDDESGITHYIYAAGSRPGYQDVLCPVMTTDDCVEARTETFILDGHSYYVTVQAYNGVGMTSTIKSRPILVDQTPPVPGHVIDALKDDNSTVDIDYIADQSRLSVRYQGFHDPHSTIKHYRLKLGTCMECDDVIPEFEAGAKNAFTFEKTKLSPGIKYITTVTACNMADLCTSASSDGVIIDVTSPITGRVLDGTKDLDIEYQATRKYVGAKWTGFADAESGIERYEWRVGTTVGGDELLKARPLPVIEIAYQSNIPDNKQLAVNTRIYITVRCYNKAGLYSEATSNGFIIDTTLPIVTKKAVLSSSIGSNNPSTSISRAILKVEWKFTDKESDIERQYVSISPHLQGDFNSSAMEVPSVLTEYTLPGLDLHDGSKYNIKVIGCNLAGLCQSSVTEDITVDSSPPTRGMFAINTDHAANLNRDRDGWFSWSTSSVQVAWLGFSDLHTGIREYRVTVGSKPFFTDLNKDGQEVTFQHVHGDGFNDEGMVQAVKLETKALQKDSSLFIAVTSINGVGLESHPIHSEFELVDGGQLDMVRRCSTYNCQGHCVCSAQDQTCSTHSGCKDVSQGNPNTAIQVKDIIDLNSATQTNYTPANTFLAGKWEVTTSQGLPIIRYEVSIGYSYEDTPVGIYDTDGERIWYDVGENTEKVFALPKEKTLEKLTSYSVFVRAWYDENTYAIFKSPGIIPITSAPSVTHVGGIAVKELKSGSSTRDIDYQTSKREIITRWTNKFRGNVEYYLPYISTHPQGHNVHGSAARVNETLYIANGLNLQENRDYYTTVLAYNKAGLVSWANSDGIRVDSSPPEAGIVHDGNGVHEEDYKSSSHDVSASWYGFTDGESGLVSYHWCCGRDDSKTDCSIHDWKNVGLNTRVQVNLSVPLLEGSKIYHKVYAVDGSGLQSDVAVSDGVTIDTTPPEVVDVEYIGQNLILNPSFEDGTVTSDTGCDNQSVQSWKTDPGSCLKLIKSQELVSKDGGAYVKVKGQIEQTVTNLEPHKSYRVLVHVGYPHDVSEDHHRIEGFVQVGKEVHTFDLDPQLCKGIFDVNEHPLVLWNKLTYVFQAVDTSGVVRIGTSRLAMELAVDDIYMNELKYVEATDDSNHFIHHTVFTPHWSSLHFTWHFKDDQSPITDYIWALGTVKGGTQVKSFSSTGSRQHVTSSNFILSHNTPLYLTVKATNAAGRYTVSRSEKILVDVTPPVILQINDGIGADVDYQLTTLVAVNWRIEDKESGVDYCEWAIGSQPGKVNIQKFTTVNGDRSSAQVKVDDKLIGDSKKLFSTVRCYNKAGLPTIASTDGVLVMKTLIVRSEGEFHLLKNDVTQYPVKDECLTFNESLRMSWSLPDGGITSKDIQISIDDRNLKTIHNVPLFGIHYSTSSLKGLKLRSSVDYNISLSTINELNRIDNYLSRKIITNGNPPIVLNDVQVKTAKSFNGNSVEVSWSDKVISTWHNLYFEVSLGTASGGSDVIQWQETKDPYLVFSLPDRMNAEELFLSVTAVDPCGLYAQFTHKFTI